MKTLVTIVVIVLFIITTCSIDLGLLYTDIPAKYLFGLAALIDICIALSFSILNDYLIVKLDN